MIKEGELNLEELCKKIQEKLENINLKDAIEWTTASWEELTEDTIVNCFKHSGFPIDKETNDELYEVSVEDNVNELLNDIETNIGESLLSIEELNNYESEEITTSNDWRDDLLEEAENFRQSNANCDEIIDLDEDMDEIPVSPPKFAEVLDSFEKIGSYVRSKAPELMVCVTKLKNSIIEVNIKENPLKQKSITEYFH